MKVLQKGAYIKHFQYGLGVVTASNAEHTDIDFDLHGMKKFLTNIMIVEQAEGTPPPRRKRSHRKSPAISRKPAVTKGS